MNSKGATGNTATKYSARDAETVRSLDNWRPGKGTGRLKKKLLDPPPTERLWLALPPHPVDLNENALKAPKHAFVLI